tara:strand:+ start:138 stop:557 length:420 start_codon:yes stop_codon:yes gene_type:complete
MNEIRKKQEEKKRQMARVTFSSRRHQGKYSVYLDKKKVGYYHLVSLKDQKTHTGAYTKSINENTHYWVFVDERTDPLFRRTSPISVHYTGQKEHSYIQRKVASLVPFPLPVYTEEEKEERAEWTKLGNKIINGIMGGAK